ncbi:acyl-CoA carboxylase subunit beta [Guptibacillus hwajinpoensis]|uniref:acyl-CoA carboxylase subunit beta n=1 Tax=Guptibacillus hwajinpoensis TaxID=208199 RepID=UPI003CFD093B
MENIVEELKNRRVFAERMGGQHKIDVLHAKGKKTARERIALLVDEGSFLELGKLTSSDIPGLEEKSPGDGVICGIARVDGRPVVVQAGDKTVFAGTEGAVHIRKTKAAHAYALKRGLPLVNLSEGGGLRMPDGMGSDGISDKLFPQEMLMHHREVPMVTAILGDSFGGPTWLAVSSDFVTQLNGTCMGVAGPRMLEIATGEKITENQLGGVEIHHKHTGQIDQSADSEEECIEQLKLFLSYLPSHSEVEPPLCHNEDSLERRVDQLLSIVPEKRNRAYNMKKVLRELVDNGEFFELKPEFGPALLTVLSRIGGRTVGIIANQPMKYAGAAGVQECEKATDFICMCDSFHIPLIFLHDIPGFRVSSEAEKGKIPTKIMMWNQALAQSTVPKLSVVIRKSVGAAYGNMCGPTMGADFVVAWPSAEINFTGPEVGVNVVYGRELMQSENPKQDREKLLEKWSFDSSPYKAAAKHLIDDVIDPGETRVFLARTLELACYKNGSKSNRNLANWPTGF